MFYLSLCLQFIFIWFYWLTCVVFCLILHHYQREWKKTWIQLKCRERKKTFCRIADNSNGNWVKNRAQNHLEMCVNNIAQAWHIRFHRVEFALTISGWGDKVGRVSRREIRTFYNSIFHKYFHHTHNIERVECYSLRIYAYRARRTPSPSCSLSLWTGLYSNFNHFIPDCVYYHWTHTYITKTRRAAEELTRKRSKSGRRSRVCLWAYERTSEQPNGVSWIPFVANIELLSCTSWLLLACNIAYLSTFSNTQVHSLYPHTHTRIRTNTNKSISCVCLYATPPLFVLLSIWRHIRNIHKIVLVLLNTTQ